MGIALERRAAAIRSRMQALGGDERRVAAILEQGLALARAHRRQVLRAAAYPLLVGLLAAGGAAWLTVTKLPLIGALASFPDRDAAPSFHPSPVRWVQPWTIAAAGGIVAAAGAAAAFGAVRSAGGRRLRSMVACELLAALPGAPRDAAACEPLLHELCAPGSELDGLAGPLLPPLAQLVATQPDTGERAARLLEVAAFYRERDERVRRFRLRLLPLGGMILAGVAVSFYAAALFVPLSRSLEAVAGGTAGSSRQ